MFTHNSGQLAEKKANTLEGNSTRAPLNCPDSAALALVAGYVSTRHRKTRVQGSSAPLVSIDHGLASRFKSWATLSTQGSCTAATGKQAETMPQQRAHDAGRHACPYCRPCRLPWALTQARGAAVSPRKEARANWLTNKAQGRYKSSDVGPFYSMQNSCCSDNSRNQQYEHSQYEQNAAKIIGGTGYTWFSCPSWKHDPRGTDQQVVEQITAAGLA